jgi:uncharacterized membrane protein YjjP (DUF1212 family)
MDNNLTRKASDTRNGFSLENKHSTRSLESVAMAALEAGTILLEAGANAKGVEGIVQMIAQGLGAERVELRVGYASLAVSIGIGDAGITRMRRAGELGVNQRLIQAIWSLAGRVAGGKFTAEQTRLELARLRKDTPRHPVWLIALATGMACAAFGRLLGTDWSGTGAVFLAATVGQFVRRELLSAHVNGFLSAAIVSFLSCVLGGLGARSAGSATTTTAMIASILMLVPGVPAVNALSDILEGYPTLGSARAVTVVVILIFVAAGLWLGNASLSEWRVQ